ncbi:uncharacterized protein LOC105442482 [Strongylocentrotus purpuratus]|uniref:Uncharacterized protein n=1 Tax=Strongylocentrotus purpuratus TaxID=7668 RepID=A0A7M7NJU5_STRPU|nr:uncharacterized protein LOC105442482 [Strongylocentrotus purpuratus]XP_030837694.1 uncharacterized protein LOC105442482 [Strongylocentrotus purpuratus]
MSSWTGLQSVRDCQTQTFSQDELELASMQAAENAKNHQREPEASVSRDEKGGKEDQPLLYGTDTNQGRQEDEKPLNGTSAQPPCGRGTGADHGGDSGTDRGAGGNPGKGPNAPKDPNAKAKKVAKYVIGFTATAAAIGIGAFIAAPFVLVGMGFTTAGIASGSIGAGMMSASAIASGGGVAAGSAVAVLQSVGAAGGLAATACAGLGIGGAAAITGLVAAGEVTVGAVRYIKKQKNRCPTEDAATQTDPKLPDRSFSNLGYQRLLEKQLEGNVSTPVVFHPFQ